MDMLTTAVAKVPETLGITKSAKSDTTADGAGFLYMGGGGSTTDEANVWAEAFNARQCIVIWLFAMPRERRAGTLAGFAGGMAAHGPQGAEAGYEVWATEKSLHALCMPEKSGVFIDLKEAKGWHKDRANVILLSPEGQSKSIRAEQSFTF